MPHSKANPVEHNRNNCSEVDDKRNEHTAANIKSENGDSSAINNRTNPRPPQPSAKKCTNPNCKVMTCQGTECKPIAGTKRKNETEDSNPAPAKKDKPPHELIHITASMFNSCQAPLQYWNYPPSTAGRLHKRHWSALDLATRVFNHDLANIVFAWGEKHDIMAMLFQTPTSTQLSGDMSSYTECRRVRDRLKPGDNNTSPVWPTFHEAMIAMLLFANKPPLRWKDCSAWTKLITHLCSYDSGNPTMMTVLDELLTAAGRRRLATKAACPADTAATQTAAVTKAATKYQVPDHHQELFDYALDTAKTNNLRSRLQMRGLAIELDNLGWEDLARYGEKMFDTTVAEDDRKQIRSKLVAELAARMNGDSSTLLPPHYTFTCECGIQTTFQSGVWMPKHKTATTTDDKQATAEKEGIIQRV
ncbi:hypothetical protein CH35J_009889 [Colletotrichum higginsianum]|uniref:Uncharacterized protein n=1 Tax=Colletotrichum higginsianum TaxID=80884 RepID=A0A4T0VNI5_9PEZI|nr:hypothetical protein CH35J_009889 [Colletotrichum higginsianum]